MKGYDAFAGVVKSGGKTRRAAKMVILDADHPDVLDFIDSKAHEEKKAWALIEAGYDPSFTGEAYGSVFFQNANHSVRVTDDFMQAVDRRRRVDDPRGRRRQADGHVQGPRHLPPHGRGRPPLRRPGHPVRHHHQRLAHLGQHGPHLREQPVLRVHVPQRHRLQPGQPQPDEVRRRRRRVRRRGVSLRGQADPHGAGDPGRQRQLPDAEDRGELPQLPPARARLRQPRRAADEPRPGLRLRRGPQLRRHPDRDHARRGVQAVGDHRPRPRRPVRRVQGQRGAVPAGHQEAPHGRLPDPDRRRPQGPRCATRPRSSTRRSSWASSTATATRRSPCWRPPAPSPS